MISHMHQGEFLVDFIESSEKLDFMSEIVPLLPDIIMDIDSSIIVLKALLTHFPHESELIIQEFDRIMQGYYSDVGFSES